MIYTCDALLPTAQRYASLKFRRYSRWFKPTKLDYGDALELVSFVEAIGGVRHARWIFHWTGQASVKAYERLKQHVLVDAEDYIHANRASIGLDDGLAVLRAMQDGGWRGYGLPECVRKAIQVLNEDHSQPEIAKRLGLTLEQVNYACGRRGLKSRAGQAAAYGSLGI